MLMHGCGFHDYPDYPRPTMQSFLQTVIFSINAYMGSIFGKGD